MLSVVILTFNSAKYLREVLESASFAGEIILVDSGSTDETEKIAAEFEKVKFISQKWLGFGAQKQFGVDRAKNEWIFVLDSDEIITSGLKFELLETLKNPKFAAYKVARLNYFWGKALKHGGFYPDFSVRFFHRKFAQFDGREIHEKVVLKKSNLSQNLEPNLRNSSNLKPEISNLKNHFIHYAYESVEQFIAKQNRYSSLGANLKKRSKFKAIFNPFWAFFKIFFIKGGFRDGWTGFVVAKLYSQYTFWKYIK